VDTDIRVRINIFCNFMDTLHALGITRRVNSILVDQVEITATGMITSKFLNVVYK